MNAKPARRTQVDFDTVLKIGASLPGVTASSGARGVALKSNGKLVACTATNPSAEPDSLMVCIDFTVRDALVENRADTYYMTPHYQGYATVLVRLAKIGRSELRHLLGQAAQFVGAQQTQKKAAKKPANQSLKKISKRAAPRRSR